MLSADPVHGMDRHLAEPIAGPHDVRKVYRPVRAVEDKSLTTVLQCDIGRFIGVPMTLFLMALQGLVTISGTCLWAAAR